MFSSVPEFLQHPLPETPACLVLDVRMPGQSGLELQRKLAATERPLPIIFITAHGDIPMSVSAMKAGAVEFLTKPFRIRICWTRFTSPSIATVPRWRAGQNSWSYAPATTR